MDLTSAPPLRTRGLRPSQLERRDWAASAHGAGLRSGGRPQGSGMRRAGAADPDPRG